MSNVFKQLFIDNSPVISIGGKCFKKLSSSNGGLYDANDNLVASWGTLSTTYGMDSEKDYTSATYKTDKASPYYVLKNNSELSSGVKLIVSNGVRKIGNFAFMDCTSLKSITIPESVIKFGEGAFKNCKFQQVYYTGDVASWCAIDCFAGEYTEDNDQGYDEGSALIEVENGSPCCATTKLYINNELVVDLVIPYGVTSIGACAFRHCSTMKSLSIPDTVTSIGNSAFAFCTSITGVTLPNSLTSIGKSIFAGCSSLKSGNIPTNATYVAYAMYSETAITSITIPSGVTSIGRCAFQLCEKLTSIDIPDSVTKIYPSAFAGCYALKSVSLGNGVTSIGNIAFAYAPITSITIPKSVTFISEGVFYYTSLTSATFMDTEGWYVATTEGATSGTNLSSSNLANTSTAAKYLKTSYVTRFWYKK